MPEKAAKRYRVANPRGIPAGIPIVRVTVGVDADGNPKLRPYFEGDRFEGEPPKRFVRDGFVVAEESS